MTGRAAARLKIPVRNYLVGILLGLANKSIQRIASR
jgi:hypothetical protein